MVQNFAGVTGCGCRCLFAFYSAVSGFWKDQSFCHDNNPPHTQALRQNDHFLAFLGDKKCCCPDTSG